MYVKIITYFLSFFDKVNKNKIIEFFKKNITELIHAFLSDEVMEQCNYIKV